MIMGDPGVTHSLYTILKPFLCMDLDAPGVTDRTGSVEGVIDFMGGGPTHRKFVLS